MDAIAELDQLTDSLTGTIAALRGLCGDALREKSELVTAVSNVANGLSSIQSNIEGIRCLLAGLHTKAEGDCNDDAVSGAISRCEPQFRTGLKACMSISGVVIKKLDVVVILSEPEEDWGYESDWGSLADSVRDVKSTLSNQMGDRDEILKRAEDVVGPLCAAWRIIFDALEANQTDKPSSSQEVSLESRVSREVFRQLEKRSSGLSSTVRGRNNQPWTALFRPLRFLGRSHSDVDPLSSPGRSLTRTKTWPTVLLKSTVDPEVVEARKRSANIDKQIQADSATERKRCTLMLLHGNRESKVVLTDTFAALANEEVNVPTTFDPRPIRESLSQEIDTMTWIAKQTKELGADELVCLRALENKRERESLQTLDEEVVGLLQRLWSLDHCQRSSLKRGRPGAYDKMVLDALSRSVADEYLPTPADHRRFNQSIVRTFTFNFDPISVNLMDHGYLLSRGRRPRALLWSCMEDTTSFILPIDLAQYDTVCSEDDTPFKSALGMMSSLASRKAFRQSRASIVIIFHNVKEFRASLKEKLFSAIYTDFAGKNDARETISYMMKKSIAACGPKAKIYPYVGELSSRSTVRFILAAAKETMLHRALVEAGFF